ncbi:MAG: hypothetical protein JWP01_2956 [Myxococcales bacterium]|nr:hypothetical protein [Myxococcales bacterium]
MAVAARNTGPSDARVPCPLCGGLIHPIAGRCKHCKADVHAQRATRPAASMALPPLSRVIPTLARPADPATFGTPDPATLGAPNGYAPHLAETLVGPNPGIAVFLPVRDESRPILPPRPTGRMQTEPMRGSVWRNWPVIVIVLAVIAIAAAVVLMLWPPSSDANADSRRLAPPPAPERMDTNPMAPRDPGSSLPPQGGADPWSNRGGVVPRATPPAPAVPDDPDDLQIDPDDLFKDPFANPRGGSGGLGLGNPFGSLGGSSAMLMVMLKHACERTTSCPSSPAGAMCSMIEQQLGTFPAPALPAGCVAAQRCLAQIDQLDVCGSGGSGPAGAGGLDQVQKLLLTAQDCIEASHC